MHVFTSSLLSLVFLIGPPSNAGPNQELEPPRPEPELPQGKRTPIPPAEPASLSGVVVWNGQPAQARVRVVGAGRIRRTWTDAAGRFRFDDLPAGSIQLQATLAASWRGVREADVTQRVRLEPGNVHETVLRVPADDAKAFVDGRVVDVNGVPIVGARVAACRRIRGGCGLAPRLPDPETITRTDAQGRYRLRLKGELWRDLPFEVGVGYGLLQSIRKDARAGDQGLDFQLPEMGCVELRLPDDRRRLPLDAVYWRSNTSENYDHADGFAFRKGVLRLKAPVGTHDLVLVPRTTELAPLRLSSVPFSPNSPSLRDVRFEPGHSLELAFVGPDGTPAPPPYAFTLLHEDDAQCIPGFGLRTGLVFPEAPSMTMKGLGQGTFVLPTRRNRVRFSPSAFRVPHAGPVTVRWWTP